jgi:hypothetical protein
VSERRNSRRRRRLLWDKYFQRQEKTWLKLKKFRKPTSVSRKEKEWTHSPHRNRVQEEGLCWRNHRKRVQSLERHLLLRKRRWVRRDRSLVYDETATIIKVIFHQLIIVRARFFFLVFKMPNLVHMPQRSMPQCPMSPPCPKLHSNLGYQQGLITFLFLKVVIAEIDYNWKAEATN